MNEEQFEALLFEEESTTLDFKESQYRFAGEDDAIKSEVLKDILSFANAWRRTDAYILRGVKEVRGGRSEVTGVESHLNDHELQQFVNSKTQRPVAFSYRAFATGEGKQIGIIHIPPQDRPLYLKKDFGKLKARTVYVRRGSATEVAEPDEISKMGAPTALQLEEPLLSVQLAAPDERLCLGEAATVTTVLYEPPESIPDYGRLPYLNMIEPGANKDYYRELAAYKLERCRVAGLRFALTNSGSRTAHDVRLEASLIESNVQAFLYDEYEIPVSPASSFLARSLGTPVGALNPDLTVEQLPGNWRVVAEFGKCQPKQLVFTSDVLYIGGASSGTIELECKIFADELAEPLVSRLIVNVEAEARALTLDTLRHE